MHRPRQVCHYLHLLSTQCTGHTLPTSHVISNSLKAFHHGASTHAAKADRDACARGSTECRRNSSVNLVMPREVEALNISKPGLTGTLMLQQGCSSDRPSHVHAVTAAKGQALCMPVWLSNLELGLATVLTYKIDKIYKIYEE